MPPQELLSSQDSEQELLLENFKAAANCLTNLYRNSLNVEKRAKNLGIQYALESVLSWVGEQASTGKQTVSLEELVSFCYQLSDQMGSSENNQVLLTRTVQKLTKLTSLQHPLGSALKGNVPERPMKPN
ncbi:GTPase Obg [Galdieria sulphuraria]|nr:GTPase Obg [Galdieria sulphuraria]